MTTAMDLLRDALAACANENRPLPRTVRLHPDDYAAIKQEAALACVYPSDDRTAFVTLDGVYLCPDEWVAKGKPWPEP
jgi:hypothetical protein